VDNISEQRVLVTGVGGPAGSAVVRYLKKKGFFVVGTDINKVDTEADLFIKVLPALSDGFREELLGIIDSHRPSLIIPTVTEELVTIAELRDRLVAMGTVVYISPADTVRVAWDKFETVRFLEARGIAVPRTFMAGEASKEDIAARLGFPLLAKPLKTRGGRGVRVFESMEELMAEERTEIVFQEFIAGEEFDANLFVTEDGRVDACVVLRKTALKAGLVGNALSVERVEDERVGLLAKKVVEAMRCRGPVDVDIRCKKDGTPTVLEVNARVGGNILDAPEILDSLIKQWRKEVKRR